MTKSQQLYQELMMQKKTTESDDLPDDLHREYVCPPKVSILEFL
jgi:hypothetical protein